MSESIQVSFDAANPQRLGEFWAAVLGYLMNPPPEGFDSWEAFLDSVDWPADQRDAVYAIVDPELIKPRFLYQKVPEGKAAKNRVHIDVKVGAGLPRDERKSAVRTRADEIVALGATELRAAEENGEYWIVLHDIEGNEFCLQ